MHHREHFQVDLLRFSEEDRYKFLMGAIVPRPIALVTSLSSAGTLNAAPFSQFVVISVTPPLLGFVAHKGPKGHKDTVANILQSREFVINTVSEPMAIQVQQCAIAYPSSVSEVEQVGFHTLRSETVRPQRIGDSAIQFECRLHRTVNFGPNETAATLIVGEITAAHCADGVIADRRINHQQLNALGRIAGRSYCRTADRLDV